MPSLWFWSCLILKHSWCAHMIYIHTSIHICLCAGMQFALYVFMAISLMLLRLFKSIITCYQATNRFVWFSICKTASPPPADVGWSINNGGISGVGRRRLEYELPKILGVGWGINYIRHPYPSCALRRRPATMMFHMLGLLYSIPDGAEVGVS